MVDDGGDESGGGTEVAMGEFWWPFPPTAFGM